MKDIDWVLEHLARGATENIWRAGFIGMGGIGHVRVVFDPKVVPTSEDIARRQVRIPCCPLQAVAVLTQRANSEDDRLRASVLTWQQIAVLLNIKNDDARAIARAADMTLGHDPNLRQEIVSALGLIQGPQETLSFAP